ncbi:helix-turn-helix transcriptional regulator [Streptomyces sp. KN37]|uniref:helix-turn-helix domain-containing protein n=1 Tax=Streptomyces sp. KN37 TaxID=3090667 RepID=UPI002A76305F|nr:helix-turn-helix transcriptional regulator [Streptomyces sp. KN37]WPO76707.1 helix-turn-helix transcriptional regulator [Streptomyces sp. KN37]
MQRGLPLEQLVTAISQCCSVSKLRAHRLARGWTLREAADRLQALGCSLGPNAPRPDVVQLSHWEKGRQPRVAAMQLLTRLYECDLASLGFTPHQEASATLRQGTHTAEVRNAPAFEQGQAELLATDPLANRESAVRRTVNRTLAATTISPQQLDELDDHLLLLRQQYVYMPPETMLADLLDQLDEVRALADERQPAGVQVRISEQIAMLSTLVADSLMKLGRLSSSRAWYATARTAADDSGNSQLRARVRAQAAMLPYYYGPIDTAVRLAASARMLCRGRPTATSAFASAAEARALAQQGDTQGAEAAIRLALATFERCETGPDNDAFAFPLRRLLLYLSGAYTAMGHTSQARKVQTEALALYPSRTGIDPALLHLEAAICLARERSSTEACQLASTTYLRVHPAMRTHILEERARQVIQVLPPAAQRGRAAKELDQILALPPAQG